ncbi:unnamed protein product [Lampetra planeri]
MPAVFEPPRNTRQKFAVRCKEDGELALAYRSVLLVLAKAAFPKMDHDGLDTLVLEKMLGLAKDLHTVLPTEDSEVSSLKIARCIQAQQTLQHDRVLVACATSSTEPGAHTDEEPAPACSLHQRSGVRWDDGDCQRDDWRRARSALC